MAQFDKRSFAARGGTLSEKLAVVFEAIGATHDGELSSTTYGKIIGVGDLGTAKTISPSGVNTVPLQIKLTANTDATEGYTIGAAYFSVTSTVDQLAQFATCMVRTTISKDVFDAYGLQSHVSIGSAACHTHDNNAHITAISGKLTFSAGETISKGWLTAGLFIVEGAGVVTQLCYGVSIVVEAASTGCLALLHLNSDAAVGSGILVVGGTNMTYMLNIDGATGAAVVAAGQPAGHSAAGYISIKVGATAYAVPFWTVANMADS